MVIFSTRSGAPSILLSVFPCVSRALRRVPGQSTKCARHSSTTCCNLGIPHKLRGARGRISSANPSPLARLRPGPARSGSGTLLSSGRAPQCFHNIYWLCNSCKSLNGRAFLLLLDDGEPTVAFPPPRCSLFGTKFFFHLSPHAVRQVHPFSFTAVPLPFLPVFTRSNHIAVACLLPHS